MHVGRFDIHDEETLLNGLLYLSYISYEVGEHRRSAVSKSDSMIDITIDGNMCLTSYIIMYLLLLGD